MKNKMLYLLYSLPFRAFQQPKPETACWTRSMAWSVDEEGRCELTLLLFYISTGYRFLPVIDL